MEIELTTDIETAPLEVLDLQVSSRPDINQSLLSVKMLCRHDRNERQWQMPKLTWYEANRLQRFSREMAGSNHSKPYRMDLMDAGLRLTGSVRRQEGRWTSDRTIQIEPLPSSKNQFSAFTIHASRNDILAYASKLYHRLWEVFTRG
ncbi:hypothetical protein IC229_30570 [Spirosoma sp. BT702]|uniref:Uncharacterized protein n=1 Tax=Spirosoma profusum TaxID=2771354 RepID=A0A927AV63_9BACT|nr:hypothetical protein [Spirosoma profusum]MBD2705013.1 hypothetical protein [Spirosoma profusum]